MFPDLNRDGKKDVREYYDDLGGAYHFRPPGLDKPIRGSIRLRQIAPYIDFIFWMALGLTIYFIF